MGLPEGGRLGVTGNAAVGVCVSGWGTEQTPPPPRRRVKEMEEVKLESYGSPFGSTEAVHIHVYRSVISGKEIASDYLGPSDSQCPSFSPVV